MIENLSQELLLKLKLEFEREFNIAGTSCSADFLDALNNFSDRINRLEEDGYEQIILMARKSACLFQCLVAIGKINTSLPYASDRALGMDLHYLKSKKVALIDDLVIKGTSLFSAKSRLEKHFGANVDVFVLAGDKDLLDKKLCQPIEPYPKYPTRSCTQLSRAIVRAFSIFPRPYSVDYPLLSKNELFRFDTRNLLSDIEGYSSEDRSLAHQTDSDAFQLTYHPEQQAIREISEAIELDKHFQKSSLFKVRLFGRYFEETLLENGRRGTIFRLIPMVSLPAIKKSNLTPTIKYFSSLLPTDFQELFLKQFAGGRASYRLVNYLIAVALARHWFHQINSLLSDELSVNIDPNERTLLFGSKVSFLVKILETNENLNFSSLKFESNHIARPKITLHRYEPDTDRPLGYDYLGAYEYLISPFRRLYSQREVPFYENLSKTNGTDIYIALMSSHEGDLESNICAVSKQNPDWDTQTVSNIAHRMDRLREGLSYSDLLWILKNSNAEETNKWLLSKFLDEMVDLGAVVPITETVLNKDGEKICKRSYRHGEEIALTREHLRRIGIFLKSFMETSGRSTLDAIWMEKVLCLGVRSLVASGLVEGYQGGKLDNDTQIVSLGYYRYGQITYISEYQPAESLRLYRTQVPGQNITPLREILLSEKYSGANYGQIKGVGSRYSQSGSEKLFKFNRLIPSTRTAGAAVDIDEGDEIEFKVKKLGALAGAQLSEKNNNSINSDGYNAFKDSEFKKLLYASTCFTFKDIAYAIYAELDLLRSDWGTPSTDPDLRITRAVFNRTNTKDLIPGLKSGIEKYTAGVRKISQNWHSQVFEGLKNSGEANQFQAFLWKSAFPSIEDCDNLETRYNNFVHKLHTLNSVSYYLILILHEMSALHLGERPRYRTNIPPKILPRLGRDVIAHEQLSSIRFIVDSYKQNIHFSEAMIRQGSEAIEYLSLQAKRTFEAIVYEDAYAKPIDIYPSQALVVFIETTKPSTTKRFIKAVKDIDQTYNRGIAKRQQTGKSRGSFSTIEHATTSRLENSNYLICYNLDRNISFQQNDNYYTSLLGKVLNAASRLTKTEVLSFRTFMIDGLEAHYWAKYGKKQASILTPNTSTHLGLLRDLDNSLTGESRSDFSHHFIELESSISPLPQLTRKSILLDTYTKHYCISAEHEHSFVIQDPLKINITKVYSSKTKLWV